jgi:prophage tail gpP-like protein
MNTSANISIRLYNASTQGTTTTNGGVVSIPTTIIQASSIAEYEKYDYHQNFMQPADAWSLHVGADRISDQLASQLQNNAVVYLDCTTSTGTVRTIGAGYIDQIKLHNYREGKGGTYYEIRGRTFLAQAIDDGIDPWSNRFDFAEGTTLGQLIGSVFLQYGIDVIYSGTDANVRDIVTGVNPNNPNNTTSTSTIFIPNLAQEAYVEGFSDVEGTGQLEEGTTSSVTVVTDPSAPPLEQLSLKKCKPEPHETAFSFCETHCKRFHLHIWGVPDATAIVVGVPDFTQAPTYTFTNQYSGEGNNCHDTWVELDSVNMPSAIIAKGWSGGGDFATTTVKCVKVNEFLGYSPGAYQDVEAGGTGNSFIKPSVLTRINRYKTMPILAPTLSLLQWQSNQATTVFGGNGGTNFNFNDVKSSVIYWTDQTSKTQAELEAAVQRRMSEFMRNAVRVHIKVDGHDQNGAVYRYNTTANVYDEKLKINSIMWIEDVLFRRSREEGTITELTLIPCGILSF